MSKANRTTSTANANRAAARTAPTRPRPAQAKQAKPSEPGKMLRKGTAYFTDDGDLVIVVPRELHEAQFGTGKPTESGKGETFGRFQATVDNDAPGDKFFLQGTVTRHYPFE